MWGNLLGSESVCQPACKRAWKIQPSLGSLPRVIQALPLQVFWSRSAPEKALLTFRDMVSMCSPSTFPFIQCSSAASGIYWAREKHPVQFVVYSRDCSCKMVMREAVWGALGTIYLGKQSYLPWGLRTRRHTCCTARTGNVLSKFCGHAEAIYFYFYFSNT